MKSKCFFCLILAVIVNFLGSVLARHIAVPLYLDSVMTFAVTALCGVWCGIACAVLSNAALWIFYDMFFPFALCHVLTALVAHYTFRHYKRHGISSEFQIDTFLWAGLWSAITNAISGDLIISFFISANSNPNISNSVQGIFIAVPNLTFAIYFSGVLTNLTDKMISAALSFLVYKRLKQLG